MPKTLVAFGCSWTYGDELLDPNIKSGENCSSRHNEQYRNDHCFAGLVAKHYNLDFINTASPGGSLESTRYALYYILQNYCPEDLIFVVGLTNSIRQSWFDASSNSDNKWDRFVHNTSIGWPTNPSTDWEKLNYHWYSKCNCPDQELYNIHLTLGYFNGSGVPTVFVPVFDDLPELKGKNICNFVLENILDSTDLEQNKHPNETGHQKISKRLIEYIDSVKLI